MLTVPTQGGAKNAGSALSLLNAAGALVAAGYAVQGVVRTAPSGPRTPGMEVPHFWAAASAIRTCAITIPLLRGLANRRGPSPNLLRAAALVQFGDAYLGVRTRNVGMTVAPVAMGLVHLTTARLIERPDHERPN